VTPQVLNTNSDTITIEETKMDKLDLLPPLAIAIALLGLFSVIYITTSTLGNATRVTDNMVVGGVFESVSIDENDVTIHFSNSSVTYFQSGGFFGSGGNSLQVPFVVGRSYECIFAVHGNSESKYLTLQSVVEVP
jgi:hypothetical protein